MLSSIIPSRGGGIARFDCNPQIVNYLSFNDLSSSASVLSTGLGPALDRVVGGDRLSNIGLFT